MLSESQAGFEPGFSTDSEGPAWGAHMSLAEGAACLAFQKHELWDHTTRGHRSPNLFGTSLCSNPIKNKPSVLSSAEVNLGQIQGKCSELHRPVASSSLCGSKQRQDTTTTPLRSPGVVIY